MASKKKSAKYDFVKKVKKNPWKLTTFVFALLSIVLLVSMTFGGNSLTAKQAGNNFVDYINSMGATQIEYVDSQEFSDGLYEVTVLAQGKEIPVHVTKDGLYYVQGVMPLSQQETEVQKEPTPQEVVKSDTPKAELFIWSYCPYGVTAQAPFAEVAQLLGDSADFEVALYYAGHGDYEMQQNKIQACIQELGVENYWDYATGFVEDIYPKCGPSRDIDCDKEESVALMNSLGIDSDAVLTCVEEQGDALYEADYNRAKELGVTGSPSLVINDVKVNAGRNAAAYLEATCSAFNDAPEACGEELSSAGTANAPAAGAC